MMPNRKNKIGFGFPNPLLRNMNPLPVVGRTAVVMPNNLVRPINPINKLLRPTFAFGPKKGMKINFA